MEWLFWILALIWIISVWIAIEQHREVIRLEALIKEKRREFEQASDRRDELYREYDRIFESLRKEIKALKDKLKKYTSCNLYIDYNN